MALQGENQGKNMDITSIRQFIVSRWECCLVGREHISRQVLVVELAAFTMLLFYFITLLPFFVYEAVIIPLHNEGLISFDITFVKEVILWGACLHLMMVLGLLSYAGLIRLAKDCRLTAARVSFFISIFVLSTIFYTGYIPALSFHYSYYGAGDILFLLTTLCTWIFFHFNVATIPTIRFWFGGFGGIDKLYEARTLKYYDYIAVDLLFAVLFVGDIFLTNKIA